MRFLSGLLFALALHGADVQPLTKQGEVYALSDQWKAQRGDDPAWASPQFDDSTWPIRTETSNQTGYGWYRQTINLPPIEGPISLWCPSILSAGEIYINGQLLGQHGVPQQWWTHRRDPVSPIRLPASLREAKTLTIAIRVSHASTGPGISGTTLIGSSPAIDLAYDSLFLQIVRRNSFSFVVVIFPILGFLGSLLYWRGKSERIEYFWYAGICCSFLSINMENFRPLGQWQGLTLFGNLLLLVGYYGAWRFFVGERQLSQLLRFIVPFLLAVSAAMFIAGRMLLIPWVPTISVALAVGCILLAMNAWAVHRRWLAADRDALWIFIPYAVCHLGYMLFFWNVISLSQSGSQTIFGAEPILLMLQPIRIEVSSVAQILSEATMAWVLLRRTFRLLGERQVMAAEFESAKQMQEFLLPSSDCSTSDLEIHATYLPALHVGGDFYQVTPCPDGSVLVVVGDVSGKGMKAALLVSVAVGILRNEKSTSPAAILSALNDALVGRAGGAFITCCCARFDKDGWVTIANAGHPSAYGDGEELQVDAGLPLGITHVSYSELRCRPKRLTIVSDGVVEAENANRELFGFDRTREISAKSAQEIAEAARAWGQTDDITVVTVRRNK